MTGEHYTNWTNPWTTWQATTSTIKNKDYLKLHQFMSYSVLLKQKSPNRLNFDLVLTIDRAKLAVLPRSSQKSYTLQVKEAKHPSSSY